MKKSFNFIIVLICTIFLPNVASAYELNVEEEFLRYHGSVPDAIENANQSAYIQTSDKGYLESYYNYSNEDVIINGETISPQGDCDSYLIKY